MAYLGKTPSQAVRSRYYFTASGGETSLSGTDDNSNTLTFTDGNYVDVSLNGVALVAGTDYNTTTANTIGGLTALVASDVVEVVVYDTFSVFSGEFRGDISLGDNVKAKFGASDDLQIYHDGSNSIINDNGTGALQLQTGGSTKLATTATGVDITGTLTSDGLAVGGSNFANTTYTGSSVNLTGVYTGLTSDGGFAVNVRDSGYLQFSTSNAERMRIDSSGNVGIGTSSPAKKLDVDTTMRVINAAGTSAAELDVTAGGTWRIRSNPTSGTNSYGLDFIKGSAGTDVKMSIDSSGNVGIGTTSPAQALVVNRSSGNTYLEVSRATQSQGQLALQLTGGTGGTNWIMYQDTSSNDLKFFGNSADRMTIDSNGNVGIGTTSPTYKVDVSGTNPALRLKSSAAFGYIIDQNTSSGLVSHIVYENVDMRFGTNSTERMRINSSGYLLVGTTSTLGSNPARLEVYTVGSGGRIIQTKTDINGNTNHLTFNTPSGQAGQIYTNTLTTTYGTSSDYRLKENVVDLSDATTRLKQLAPKRFNFIADVDAKTVDGFLAHEVQSIVPEAIYGIKDEVDADGNPVYQGIDQSKLVPLLTAALKEAITKIETLETEMTSVKARLDALEAN
jgi:uncharacterized protein YaiE (UPF0345 family)